MEIAANLPVLFSERAIQDLDDIANYIAEQGYPDTALFYTDRIYAFCQTLCQFPGKYKACKRKGFKRNNYRCAFFEKTYTIAYRIEKNQTLVIKRIIHGKRLGMLSN